MILDTSPQGSEAWYRQRAGALTASEFKHFRKSSLMTRGEHKGDYGAEGRGKIFTKAIERISGLPLEVDDGFEVWQAKRGHVLEPHARVCHERKADLMVETAGFVKSDDGFFGATADGFADDADGTRIGCEYKCFLAPEKLRAILIDGDLTDVMDQVDGGMWLTGLKRWHFGLYCPALTSLGLEFHLVRVNRNDDRIEALEEDLIVAHRRVEDMVVLLRQRAGLNSEPVPTKVETAAEIVTELKQIVTELPDDIFA